MYFGKPFVFLLAVLGLHFGVWLFSSCWRSMGSRAHRLRNCGLGALAGSVWDLFPDQGLNSCPLCWNADS